MPKISYEVVKMVEDDIGFHRRTMTVSFKVVDHCYGSVVTKLVDISYPIYGSTHMFGTMAYHPDNGAVTHIVTIEMRKAIEKLL